MRDFNAIDDFIDDASFRNWVLRNNPESGLSWNKWLMENPEKLEVFNEARAVLLELDLPGNDWNAEKERVLHQKIQLRINKKTIPLHLKQNKSKNYAIYGYGAKAAVIAFVLILSVVGFLQLKYATEKEIDISAMLQDEYQWITKSNPKGQKSKIHLPDGSTVILNAESQIRFNNDFGKSDRDIFLKGESFFEVAKDSLLPFRVFSGDLVTTALGTSFNINSYDKDRVNVQLATGQVKVFKENLESESLLLKPGEEVILEEHGQMSKRNFDKQTAFLWKDGTLKFTDVSFSEFKVALERWYGVEIGVKGTPSSALLISGEYKDKYLSSVLESLGYAYGFEYKIAQKKVTLKFNQ
ncbi:FecR domain-containing protein [uncultured Cyclobacterium sp.]|uniref:FecR family protein n=1 Tax=uncultured Cyclobacterium sp. TaxID=453820 RepID=UPI0030EC8E85|tara:strand:- start:66020 stop:67081 length:1062 start_codon:yes stop_codon:yes gene_type:complete